jgi:hypothetical protein
VTDIDVATISHVQKNLAAPRLSRIRAIPASALADLLVNVDAHDGVAGVGVVGWCAARE